MTKAAFDKIAAGLNDAIAFAKGDESRARIAKPVDVKAIRTASKMSQEEFARTFRLPVGTVRDWEQHRSEPDTAAKVLLSIIATDPSAVARLVEKAA